METKHLTNEEWAKLFKALEETTDEEWEELIAKISRLNYRDMSYEDLENRVSALEEIVIDSGQTKREYLFRVAMNCIKNSEQKYDVKNYVFELYDSRETYKYFFYISLFFNFVFVWMLFHFN